MKTADSITDSDNTVVQSPASVDGYIRHGWSLIAIPPNSKGPRTPGWQLKANALKSQADLPVGHGIGLAHAYSSTMALDIDDWDAACELLMSRGVDLQALYDAPDSVVIDSGRAGHGKLIYKMPFGMTPVTRRVIVDGKTIYELRCSSASGHTVQDVIPPSIHPMTGQAYRWAGNGKWNDLPTIPNELQALWTDLLDQDLDRNIKIAGDPIEASWTEIRSAVEAIPASCPRSEWVTVGMALQWAGTQTNQLDQALHIWNDWSKGSPEKYPGEREIYSQWVSFKSDKSLAVKLGSLFHLARLNGWTRPPIDVSHLFRTTDLGGGFEQSYSSLLPPAPRVDLSLFPSVLATRAAQVGESVGCDPMVPLWAGMGAACAVANATSRLELYDGYRVPPVLWLITIGEPADKKTPGSRPMFAVLDEIEKENYPVYKKAHLEWEGTEAMRNAARKAFLEYHESPEALLGGATNAIPDVPEGIPEPQQLRLKVSDVTSQKLVRLCADRPEGLLCYLDEMAGWVGKICGNNSLEDRSAWTVSYEGDKYSYDRVTAGTITAESMAVSIYGNIQPRVLRENIAGLTMDGLFQRFMPVVLDGGYTKRSELIPEFMRNDQQWNQTIRLIHSLPSMTYKLSPEAFELFREFQSWYEVKRQDERLLMSDERFMQALGKMEGTVGRIAFIWHLLESPFSMTVSGNIMRRAIQFARYYLIPAYRYTLCEMGGISPLEIWLHDYLIQHSDKSYITVKALVRDARAQLRDTAPTHQDMRIITAMVTMEERKFVVRTDDALTHQGATWALNPRLRDHDLEYRRKITIAKQRMMDEIYRASPYPEKHRAYGIDEFEPL